jgi:hypothetical protein
VHVARHIGVVVYRKGCCRGVEDTSRPFVFVVLAGGNKGQSLRSSLRGCRFGAIRIGICDAKRYRQMRKRDCMKGPRGRSHCTRNARAKLVETQEQLIVE